MPVSPQSHAAGGRSHDSLDDAEKGMYESTLELTAPPPFVFLGQEKVGRLNTQISPVSPVHEGITPFSSVPELSLSWPRGARPTDANELKTTVKKPAPAKQKVSRWILFVLWFNVYRRFFTFITLLNLAGIIMAALGRFPYAENHLGALVLGNLLCAVMMRNELWMRFLYMVAIYGLRSVRSSPPRVSTAADKDCLVGPLMRQAGRDFCLTACRWHSFGVRSLWCWVRHFTTYW